MTSGVGSPTVQLAWRRLLRLSSPFRKPLLMFFTDSLTFSSNGSCGNVCHKAHLFGSPPPQAAERGTSTPGEVVKVHSPQMREACLLVVRHAIKAKCSKGAMDLRRPSASVSSDLVGIAQLLTSVQGEVTPPSPSHTRRTGLYNFSTSYTVLSGIS